jgi:tripartite-type tricarboxylate transporter receptor subunit TctC
MAPPGVPQDRADALQKAFMATMADKEFLADADKAKFEITPVPGDKIASLVAELYQTPAAIAEKAGALVK